MANEILVLDSQPRGNDIIDYNVLLFYRVSPVIEVNNIVVVQTPANTLPSIVDLYNLLTQNEKDALDSGDFIFEQRIVAKFPNESNAQVLDKIKSIWVSRDAQIVPALRVKYQFTGLQVNV